MIDGDERVFEQVNALALEQVKRLEAVDKELEVLTNPPGVQSPSSFWQVEKKVTPAVGSIFSGSAAVPRSYYTGTYGKSYVAEDTNLFKKTLNAVYRQPVQSSPERKVKQNMSIPRKSLLNDLNELIGTSADGSSTKAKANVVSFPTKEKNHVPVMSQNTKNQVIAVALSGGAKILTSLVCNWARDRKVPYELM